MQGQKVTYQALGNQAFPYGVLANVMALDAGAGCWCWCCDAVWLVLWLCAVWLVLCGWCFCFAVLLDASGLGLSTKTEQRALKRPIGTLQSLHYH